MILASLIENTGLIVLLVVAEQWIMRSWPDRGVLRNALCGVVYGSIGMVAMSDPLVLAPGFIFDGRSVILAAAGMFGGPWVALIAVIMCGAFRIWLGGVGVAVGIFVIVESAALGTLFYFLRRRGHDVMRPAHILVLGLTVHVIMLGALAVGLGEAGIEAVARLWLPLITLFPLALLLIARLVLDQEDRDRMQESLRKRAQELARSSEALMTVVDGMVEIRDPYTAGHQRNVAHLAEAIAQELGLPAEEVREIRTAALLHDIGKIAVPAELLSRPRNLIAVERKMIEEHSEIGYRLVTSAGMGESIAQMVYQHQERCNGSGYPRGLTSDEILLGAKVLMVADVVEAMSSHRPYRAALGVDAALQEISEGAGVLYDQAVCDACLKVFLASGSLFE
ncbi:MAG: HD domain-containing protein [Coriobacteriia bacterium]|nr:HD domain-containing protein [Coriobacteriia bacterium]